MNESTVLFLCSGNYYRSRFAEGLFNQLAAEGQMRWKAVSAGLKIDVTRKKNVGPISQLTLAAFQKMAIPSLESLPFPRQVTAEDLESANLIVALKEAEHRILMRNHFPAWENRVTYWHVHDLDQASPEEALPEIENLVRTLLQQLLQKSPTLKSFAENTAP